MKNLLFLLVCLTNIVTGFVWACDSVSKQDAINYQQKWQQSNWKDYQFVVQRRCFCYVDYTREMLVQVNNGKVTDAEYTDTNEKVSEAILADVYTIDDWYKVIEKARDRQADRLQIHFNELVGNPSKIMIDLRKNRTDDEQTVTISDIKQL